MGELRAVSLRDMRRHDIDTRDSYDRASSDSVPRGRWPARDFGEFVVVRGLGRVHARSIVALLVRGTQLAAAAPPRADHPRR